MSENILKAAFDTVYDAEFDVSGEELSALTFSRRHQRAMKKLFKRAESETVTLTKPKIPKRKKIILIAAAGFIAVTAAVITLCGSLWFNITTKDFRGYKTNSGGETFINFSPKTVADCPTEIEQKYYFPELLENFRLEHEIMYENKDGYNLIYMTPVYVGMDVKEDKYFMLEQKTKTSCCSIPIQIRENYEIVDINGFEGIYSEKTWEPWGIFTCGVTWDNGDYIMGTATKNIDKETTLALARSVAVNPVQSSSSDESEPVSIERPTH